MCFYCNFLKEENSNVSHNMNLEDIILSERSITKEHILHAFTSVRDLEYLNS